MKKIILLLLVLMSFLLTGFTQVITISFKKHVNNEVKSLIENSSQRFETALSRSGFNNGDSISLLFHFRNEYLLVRHNLIDSREIELLFKQVVIHCVFLKSIIRHYRMDALKVFVLYAPDVYLYTELDRLDFERPSRIKMPKKEFNR